MNWVTVIWSMAAAVSLTLGAFHAAVWLQDRRSWANLCFSIAAVAVAGIAAGELCLMFSSSLDQFGKVILWTHLPIYVMQVGLIGFVRLDFGTGRWWLGGLSIGVRLISLLVNFSMGANLNYLKITSLKQVNFMGEQVWVVDEATKNQWTRLGELSSLFLLLFVVDASVALWRNGGRERRRRAVVVGGSIVVFVLMAAGVSALIHTGTIKAPYLISFPFLAIIVALGFELSREVIRAARIAEELRASEERVGLAAEAANLGIWVWNAERDELWITDRGRALFGYEPRCRLNYASLHERVHPEDRERRHALLQRTLRENGSYETEYCILLPDGLLRWVAARGRCANDGNGSAKRLLGVSMDITRQKQVASDAQQQREEIEHLSRVALVGEMATSLAHELNQPLTAMVTNASAAQRFLARGEVNLEDLRELLADIAADGRRAGEVIRGIKGMVRKVESERHAVDLNEVIANVLRLVRANALAQDCKLATELAPALPSVIGDAVQLQQVLLNLVINAFDAMRKKPATPAASSLHRVSLIQEWSKFPCVISARDCRRMYRAGSSSAFIPRNRMAWEWAWRLRVLSLKRMPE